MSRRHVNRVPKPKVPLYTPAFEAIDKLEVAMVNRTIRPEFTIDDVVEWLYPPKVVAASLAAAEYIQSTYMDPTVMVDQDGIPRLKVTFHSPKYATPKGQFAATQHTAKTCHIHEVLGEVCAIVAQCDIVRDVVEYFNDNNVHPGIARAVFPQLASLLPLENKFHSATEREWRSVSYCDALRGKIRPAVNIVATGLLCNPDMEQPIKAIMRVAPYREDREERWLGVL